MYLPQDRMTDLPVDRDILNCQHMVRMMYIKRLTYQGGKSLSSETSTRARGWLSGQLAVRATARN